ncbi:MAG: Gfo/Idh/MocA family oxidoreductase, partial [Chloroflexota bacterium]
NLLASDDVEIIINLTIPAVHAKVTMQILEAGKHAYCEKPLAITLPDAEAVMQLAGEKNLRVGCAPDTFLGSGGQTARRAIDEGRIGRPVSATAFFEGPGPDSWHPNPFFYYTEGGGPMLDMGPYYVTALVNLLGSVASVAAMTGTGFDNRVAGHEGVRGQPIPVSVTTHAAGVLGFGSGAIATVITSFDVWQDTLPHIEIHGTKGSLSVPDPNRFDGEVKVWTPETGGWEPVASQHRSDIQRGIGVADMAHSIRAGEPHRASGDLALHVLEIMLAFDVSAQQEQHLAIQHGVEQPAALSPNL